MSGILYYKFRSQLSFSTVCFDGHFVSVGEARRLIAAKMNLGTEAISELVLTDPRTGVEHKDENEQLPKSTSVVVRRVPAGQQRLRPLLGTTPVPVGQQQEQEQQQQQTQPSAAAAAEAAPQQQADEFGADPFAQQAAALLKAQQEAAQTAAAQRQEAAAGRGPGAGRGGMLQGGPAGRGGGRGRGRSVPHATYVCPRCSKIAHHWVSDCPTQGDPAYDVRHVRQPAGIPQGKITADPEGSILLPGGTLGQLATNSKAYEQHVAQMLGTSAEQQPQAAEGAGLEGGKQLLALENGGPAVASVSTSQPQQQQQQQQQEQAGGNDEDEDDALQAAAQPVKLLALPAPSTASTAPAAAAPSMTVNDEDARVQAERASLPPDLLTALCTPKEFLEQLPLLSVEGVLPSAAPRVLLRAFGRGQPLTPSELRQLQAEERQRSGRQATAGPASTAAAPVHSNRHSRYRGREEGSHHGSKHRSHKHHRSSSVRSRSRSRSRSRDRSRRSTKPRRHDDREGSRGAAARGSEDAQNRMMRHHHHHHRHRHHASRERSQQLDDGGAVAAVMEDDVAPEPEPTAHFSHRQGRQHKHTRVPTPCELSEHMPCEPADAAAAAISAGGNVSEQHVPVGGEGSQARVPSIEEGSRIAGSQLDAGSQGTSNEDRNSGDGCVDVDEGQAVPGGGEEAQQHLSSAEKEKSRHKKNSHKKSSRHKHKKSSDKKSRHSRRSKRRSGSHHGSGSEQEDARDVAGAWPTAKDDDVLPVVEDSRIEVQPAAASRKRELPLQQLSSAFVRNSLLGALDAEQPRGGTHRKRRHDTEDEARACGGARAEGNEREAVDGGGRWGHDKFEEEYGEHKTKGSKKRSLRTS